MSPHNPGFLIFTFPSAHQAMQGEDALRAAGICFTVVPPPSKTDPGCGLALRIQTEDRMAAKQVLADASVTWSGLHAAASVL